MFKNRNLIFWNGYIPVLNLGDIVINSLILKEFCNKGYTVKAYIPKVNRHLVNFIEPGSVNFISFFHYRFLIFIYGMLSFFTGNNVYYLRHPGHISSGRRKSLARYLKLEKIWAFFNIRCVRIGNSLGLFSQEEKKIEQKRKKVSYFYSLRDSISGKMLGNNTLLCPDLAFLLPFQLVEKKGDFIVISLKNSSNLPGLLRLSSSMLDCCRHSLISVAQVSEDKSFMQTDLNLEISVVFSFEDYRSRVEIFEKYRLAKFVISNRLHSLLFGMSMGCIPIAAVERIKDSKIIGIFKDNDLQECLFFIDENNFPDEQKLMALNQKDYSIMFKVQSMFKRNKEVINSFLDSL